MKNSFALPFGLHGGLIAIITMEQGKGGWLTRIKKQVDSEEPVIEEEEVVEEEEDAGPTSAFVSAVVVPDSQDDIMDDDDHRRESSPGKSKVVMPHGTVMPRAKKYFSFLSLNIYYIEIKKYIRGTFSLRRVCR